MQTGRHIRLRRHRGPGRHRPCINLHDRVDTFANYVFIIFRTIDTHTYPKTHVIVHLAILNL